MNFMIAVALSKLSKIIVTMMSPSKDFIEKLSLASSSSFVFVRHKASMDVVTSISVSSFDASVMMR